MRAYRDFKKRGLSGSTDGRGIKVAATSTPGTLVHTALASTAANEWDEVTLWAVNSSGSAVSLTVQMGGTNSPDDLITVNVPAGGGLLQVIPGLVMQNGIEIRAFAAIANVLVIFGSIQRYEQSL